jgi:hypothetical protein
LTSILLTNLWNSFISESECESRPRRVVQQWLSGEARDRIIADNNIGSGTVSSIVDNYKIGLDNLDFGSFTELMIEAKKRGDSDLVEAIEQTFMQEYMQTYHQ